MADIVLLFLYIMSIVLIEVHVMILIADNKNSIDMLIITIYNETIFIIMK